MQNKFSKLHWWIQRLSGLLLFILLGLHFFVMHFKGFAGFEGVGLNGLAQDPERGFAALRSMASQPLYKAEALLFAFLAIYHGLGGFRMVFLDFSLSNRTQRLIFWVFFLLGAGLFLWTAKVVLDLQPMVH